MRENSDILSLSQADLHGFHPAFPGSARELLDLERSVEARALPGGPAKVRVEEALAEARNELEQEAARLRGGLET